MTTTLDLNPKQAEAVTHEGRRVAVIAPPGSGKTRVIAARIAHLVNVKGASCAGILALVFTRQAAEELRSRLRPAIGDERADLVRVETFHSWGVSVLRAHGETRDVATPRESEEILQSVFKGPEAIPEARRTTQKNVRERILAWGSGALLIGVGPDSGAAFDAVVSRHFARGLLPLWWILRRTQELISTQPIPARPEHVLVDEFQDLTSLEHNLVWILEAKGRSSTFMAGDPNQRIHGFRGAEGREQLDGWDVVKLREGYRCSDRIMLFAGAALGNEASPIDFRITDAFSPSWHEEVYGAWIQNGKSLAVLCRTHADADWAHARLGGLAYRVHKPDDRVREMAVALMRLVCDPDDVVSLHRLGIYSREHLRRAAGTAGHARRLLDEAKRLGTSSLTIDPIGGLTPESKMSLLCRRVELMLRSLHPWHGDRVVEVREDGIDVAAGVLGLPGDMTIREGLEELPMRTAADGFRPPEEGIPIATIHQAKGREWEGVVVVDFKHRDEEDRRVRYVAYTRARSFLALVERSST